MKILRLISSLALLTVAVGNALAAAQLGTVNGTLEDCFGASFTPAPRVRFIPLLTPLQDPGNGATVMDAPRSAVITNGAFTAYLAGGLYDSDFGPQNKHIKILVPPTNGVYTFGQCARWATNEWIFSWTNPPPGISSNSDGVSLSGTFTGYCTNANRASPSPFVVYGLDGTNVVPTLWIGDESDAVGDIQLHTAGPISQLGGGTLPLLTQLPPISGQYLMGSDTAYGMVVFNAQYPWTFFDVLATTTPFQMANQWFPFGFRTFQFVAGDGYAHGGHLTLSRSSDESTGDGVAAAPATGNLLPVIAFDCWGPDYAHGTNLLTGRYGFTPTAAGLDLVSVTGTKFPDDSGAGTPHVMMTVDQSGDATFTGSLTITNSHDLSGFSATFSLNDSGDVIVGSGLNASSFVTADAGVVIASGLVQAQHFRNTTASSWTASSQAVTNDLTFVTASGQTMTLPIANGSAGYHYTVKLLASGSCTVASAGGTIDGASTYALSAQYKYVTVTSDGINWLVIGSN